MVIDVDAQNNPVTDFAKWTFLQEPLYRWVLFFVALALIGWAWRGVIEFMKG